MSPDERPVSMEELKSVAREAADALWAYKKGKSGPGDAAGVVDKISYTLKRTSYTHLQPRQRHPVLYDKEDHYAHLTAELIALVVESVPMLEALDKGKPVSNETDMMNSLIYNRLYKMSEHEKDHAGKEAHSR